jgi:glycerophosphoryl diester phosphodiesterase
LKKWKELFAILSKNWFAITIFELLFKLISFTIFVPMLHGLLVGIMNLTGYPYLTRENVLHFLTNLITLVSIVILLLFLTFYSMIDISAVILLQEQSYRGQKADLIATLVLSVKNAAKLLRRKNFRAALLLLFQLPFLDMGIAIGYLHTAAIPDSIQEYLRSYWYLIVLLLLVYFALELWMLRWLYAFHYFTLDGCTFDEARERSASLSRRNRKKDLLVLIGIQVFCYLLCRLFLLFGVSVFAVISQICEWLELAHIVSVSIIWMVVLTVLAIAFAFGTPISYIGISVMFYSRKKQEDASPDLAKPKLYQPSALTRHLFFCGKILLIAASLLCGGLYAYGLSSGRIKLQVESLKIMEVTAHRGASMQYPENTMAAFEGAVELGADWIELDVQQSKDGQLFVMHDWSFKRTTGVDRYSWEMTWDEIKELDAGSFFDESFAGEPIPLLSEVIEFARENDIRLNIELKPSSHDVDLEAHLVELLRQMEFEERCVVTSQQYDVLEEIKEIDPEISTVYVMSIAYGNLSRLTAADSFSVEYSNVSKRMVSRVHNAGKELFVWTVNSRSHIRRLMKLNVDNVITDDVSLARECVFGDNPSAAIIQ